MVSGINSSSSLSTATISKMMLEMVSKIDTNSDGSIDDTEMSALIKQATSSLIDTIFSNHDTDHDTDQNNNMDSLISMIGSNSDLAMLGQDVKNGGISAVSGMLPPLERAFAAADTNKDGVVSVDELSALIGMKGENLDELFNKFDTDRDGLISRAEEEIYRNMMMEESRQSGSADSDTNNISRFGQNWLSGIFEALLKGFTSTSSSSKESTYVQT